MSCGSSDQYSGDSGCGGGSVMSWPHRTREHAGCKLTILLLPCEHSGKVNS